MSWQYLNSATLLTKPNVLAGPILRKVTPDSVTVWFALQRKATVKLTVANANGDRLFDGTRDTVAVGANLHIVAVTAKALPGETQLTQNAVYVYDAAFTYPTGDITNPIAVDSTIAAATHNALLGYGTSTSGKPSFCLPPDDIFALRILHGSCRKASGAGLDNLGIVDTLIEPLVMSPLQRPHQLLLTGDQIYADDVAASLLVMLTDAATCLMGFDELLPLNAPVPATALPPFARRKVLAATGFSSEDLDSHLMSVGEYLCMYLFVWSDVLWPPVGQLPSAIDVLDKSAAFLDDVLPAADQGLPPEGWGARDEASRNLSKGIEADINRLNNLRATLPNVRRALANIPTYMIFDDHEVTDDWNMTEDIAARLYGTALGRRIVQNALVAYSLCQHWGNAPEQFLKDDATLPGTRLIASLTKAAHNALLYNDNSTDLCSIVSVPNTQSIRTFQHVSHPPGAFTYNYVIEGTAHQIIVTDTRTWRAFPRGGDEAPDLLPPEQIAAQITNAGTPVGARTLIVVLSTNAPPVQTIRTATELAFVSNTFSHYPDIHEAWDLPSIALDRLTKALSDRVGFDAGSSKKVVLLSGDVHIGFASRLHYRATTRFEEDKSPPQHANVVIAQLVASSFKKQTDDTLGLQREGYTFAKKGTHNLIPPHVTEYYIGLNTKPTGQLVAIWEGLPVCLLRAGSVRLPLPLPMNKGLIGDPLRPPPSYGTLKVTPDYSYQLDYLEMNGGGVPLGLAPLPVVPPPISPTALTDDERKLRAQLHRIASDNYRQHNRDPGVVRQIIGVNNMGDLTFSIPPAPATGPFTVEHRLRFRAPDGKQLFVQYDINMETVDPAHPADPKYPQVKP